MKKVICIALSLIIVLSSLTVFAAPTPVIKLVVDNSSGDTVELSVDIENNPGVCAFMFTVTYDQNAFEAVNTKNLPKYTLGENFSDPMISMTGGSEGEIVFTYVSPNVVDLTESGRLVTFELNKKAQTGEYAFTLTKTNDSIIAGNSAEQEVDFEIKNTVLTLGEENSSTEQTSSQENTSSEETSSVKPPVTITDVLPKTVKLVLGDDGESFKVPNGIQINVGDTVVFPKNTPLSIGGVKHTFYDNGKFYIKHNGKILFTEKTPFSFTVSSPGTYTYHAAKWSTPNNLAYGKEIVFFKVNSYAKNATLPKHPLNVTALKILALRKLVSTIK